MSNMLVPPDALPKAAAPAPRITPRPPGTPPVPPKGSPMSRVLVVENDKDCARLIEFVLDLQGYEVYLTDDLASASALMGKLTFGHIVMDLTLPDGSGIDLLRLARQTLELSTPITVVSGLRQQHVVDECMSAGANDFVSKPFSPSELVTRLGKWART